MIGSCFRHLTIEYTDRYSRSMEDWRVILACASPLVNVLLTATSACQTKGQATRSPTARAWQDHSSPTLSEVAGVVFTARSFLTHPQACRDVPLARARAFHPLYVSLGEWPRPPFTARNILTRPTSSSPRRALLPGEHSFTVRVLRASRAPGRSPPHLPSHLCQSTL